MFKKFNFKDFDKKYEAFTDLMIDSLDVEVLAFVKSKGFRYVSILFDLYCDGYNVIEKVLLDYSNR